MARSGSRLAAAALKAAVAEQAAPPRSVTVVRDFAFYSVPGRLHRWPAGAVVTDPTEVAMLIEQKAPLKDQPCQAASL